MYTCPVSPHISLLLFCVWFWLETACQLWKSPTGGVCKYSLEWVDCFCQNCLCRCCRRCTTAHLQFAHMVIFCMEMLRSVGVMKLTVRHIFVNLMSMCCFYCTSFHPINYTWCDVCVNVHMHMCVWRKGSICHWWPVNLRRWYGDPPNMFCADDHFLVLECGSSIMAKDKLGFHCVGEIALATT